MTRQVDKYFDQWYDAFAWLLAEGVPSVVVGMSDPDPGYAAEPVILKTLGCNALWLLALRHFRIQGFQILRRGVGAADTKPVPDGRTERWLRARATSVDM